ncbi:MAG: ABC transporter ATP-binding protein, partial [Marinosulfonomonas sp.]|nr:ABC transporter ATP-binding protein [Marinosulfonomonas sp.]
MTPSNWIDGFQPADGPPPQTLWRFFRWCLKGAFGVLSLSALAAAASGVLEVLTALLLGFVIDGAIESGANFITERSTMLLMIAGFFLILRPAVIGTSVGMQSIVVAPNIMPLVLSRLNRYTLGHSVQFFDDDFAGRIAQKQMQTSRAITEVVIETVNVVAFALASLVGSAVLLTAIDWRVGMILVGWLVLYMALIRWFLPRVRVRAGARAAARAALSGQIVDTVTNIKTVKLFAHHKHEDAAALTAMHHLRESTLHFGRLATMFRFTLMTVAGLVPVILVGGTLWLWSQDAISAGNIVTTGAISLRIAQMTGWVSFALMGIYAAVGEVEDGMKTLTPSHGLIDAPDARELQVTQAEVTFNDVSFAYGRETGGITDINLTIHAGEKLGIVGASGAGKSTLVALL